MSLIFSDLQYLLPIFSLVTLENMFLLKCIPKLIKSINTSIKNLFKPWTSTCKIKLLIVILSGCQDKAIYTDLFTLSKIINEFGKNYLLSFLKINFKIIKDALSVLS